MTQDKAPGMSDIMNVGKLMDTSVVTLRRDSTLAEIYAVMNQYRQSDFPVIDENSQLAGMLYEENIREALNESFDEAAKNSYEFFEAARHTVNLLSVRAEEMMLPDIGWVSTETPVGKVSAVMQEKRVRCLPVFGEGRVLGLIWERAIVMELLKQGIALKRPAPEMPQIERVSKEEEAPEKRQHPRKPAVFKLAYKPVSFAVSYQLTDSEGHPTAQQARIARCLNLSLGGMLVQVSDAFQVDDVLDLAFEIPQGSYAIRRLARVTRCVGAPGRVFNLGVVFLALSAKETAALSNFLKSLPD